MRAAEIFCVNETFTWLREPLLRRLPDGSLCCAFFTGGRGDGDLRNVVAAIRSADDGETWSGPEVLVSRSDQAAWAPSMFVHGEQAHIFWFTSRDRSRYRKANHILSTGADGRNFDQDRTLAAPWISERGVDVRHGTLLRDGRALLPISWLEPLGGFDPDTWVAPRPSRRYANFGWGGIAQNNLYCVGVMEPNEDFTAFTPHGRICRETPGDELPSVPFFEPAIAELSAGRLALLLRADMTNRLWRADSLDGGRTWSVPVMTDIPNPGSKPRVINLPDGRIVLFHNPNEKDYDDEAAHPHKYRTPLEMWVSDDDLRTWGVKRTLVGAPQLAQYPDGFFDQRSGRIYLVWEDDHTITLAKLAV